MLPDDEDGVAEVLLRRRCCCCGKDDPLSRRDVHDVFGADNGIEGLIGDC